MHFAKVGLVERRRGLSFWWSQGYAQVHPDGGQGQPWVTRPQACQDARACGKQAKFHETIDAAIAAQEGA